MNIRLTLLLLIFPMFLHAQELSNIAKSPLLQVTGGVSVNQVFTWSDLPGSYSQPYAYTIAGNMNFAIYGWSIPVSGVFSNKRWSYQQPFNMVSINPSYKWIQLFLGDNSMSFSSYTLSGHRFFGVGVELSPKGSWKFSMMAGRMQQRILPDSSPLHIFALAVVLKQNIPFRVAMPASLFFIAVTTLIRSSATTV